MTPKKTERDKQERNLFQSRLDQILSKKHPLYRLSNEINWSMFEDEFGKLYTENNGRPATN
jgi:IS5 family transposase